MRSSRGGYKHPCRLQLHPAHVAIVRIRAHKEQGCPAHFPGRLACGKAGRNGLLMPTGSKQGKGLQDATQMKSIHPFALVRGGKARHRSTASVQGRNETGLLSSHTAAHPNILALSNIPPCTMHNQQPKTLLAPQSVPSG